MSRYKLINLGRVFLTLLHTVPIISYNSNNNESNYVFDIVKEIVRREFEGCSLVLVSDHEEENLNLVEDMTSLSNPRQIIYLTDIYDLTKIQWKSTNCVGYFLLLKDTFLLQQFVEMQNSKWDFSSRYVVVTAKIGSYHKLTYSNKILRTENFVGVITKQDSLKWMILTNKVYWDGGLTYLKSGKVDQTNFTHHPIFVDKLKDFKGKQLVAVTFQWPPNVFYKMDAKGQVEHRFGMDVDILNEMARHLNFDLKFVEPKEGELWGSEDENGSWTGLAGMLSRDEGDIGVANIFLSSIRAMVIDYTSPYNMDVACFLLRKPDAFPQWQSIFYPFQREIWIAYLFSVIISSLVLYFLVGNTNNFSSLLMISIRSHVREVSADMTNRFDRSSTKIFVGFMWLYCFVVTTSYSSNLAAVLSVIRLPRSISTIRELEETSLSVDIVSDFFKQSLMTSDDQTLKSLTERFVIYPDEESLSFALQQGKTAVLRNRLVLEYLMATMPEAYGKEGYFIMKECLNPYSITIGLQKNSPLKRKFDQVIEQMVQGGLVRRYFLDSLAIQEKISKEKSRKIQGTQNNEYSAASRRWSLNHIQGIFFVYLIANLFAFCVFIAEIACHRQKVTRL